MIGADDAAARIVTALAPTRWWRSLGGLTRSGSPVEGLSWALYDFANTIFSFAIVSFAMGPWTTRALGEANGTLAFTVAGSLSVLLNALVSPALGAVSDRTGGRKRYLLVFLLTFMMVKAVMIAGNFMHLRHEQRNLAIMVGAGIIVTSLILYTYVSFESRHVLERTIR